MKQSFYKELPDGFALPGRTVHFFIVLLTWCLLGNNRESAAQQILFDFDNAPLYTPLPITQVAGGITATLSATGQGYSIQDANVLGFTPPGFSGHILYPSSVFLADLLISYDQPVTDFSIMYSCNELGCDDAATMRVTAYLNGNMIGTNTRTATFPGTWPVDTLSCSFAQGFNSVVVHYDSPPPTCQDYGVIYLADNMRVNALGTDVKASEPAIRGFVITNPVVQTAHISFSLLHSGNLSVDIFDNTGRRVKNLFSGSVSSGMQQFQWEVNNESVEAGVYFIKIDASGFSKTDRFIVVR